MANKRLRALFASIGAIWLFLLLSSLFILQPVSEAQTQRSSQPDYLAAYEILGLFNEWRLEEGLYPLRLNDTLTDLALYQAEYVNSLSRTPNGVAIHVGRNGEGPKDRARYGRFNWPYYSLSSRIEVEEIAAANSAESAIAFWQTSPPHRRASTKPAYREVGIAALPHPFGHLYVVVLGGRPNVLPALVNPITNQLYLTTDESIYNTDDQWISNPTGVRFFDEAGRPLNDDFIEWEPILDIPRTAGNRFFVLVTDGVVEVVTSVDRERDIIILPDHYPPLDAIAPIEYVLPPTATPTLTPTPPGPELLLIYDDDSFTLHNQAAYSVNLGYVEFDGGGDRLPALWWRQAGSAPLFQFPSRDCLQAWSAAATRIRPPEPFQCRFVRSNRSNLNPDERFWLSDFNVLERGQVIQTCEADAGTCEVDLPSLP